MTKAIGETRDLLGEEGDSTIVMEETRFGDFQVKVRSSTSTFMVDEPFGVGGLASGPNPYDLLSAAIGACSLMTMRLFANENGWNLDTIMVRVTHQRTDLRAPDVFVKELQLAGQLSELQREKLAEISAQCPVHLTVSRGSEVRTVLLSNAPLSAVANTRCGHMRDMHEAVNGDRQRFG